MGRLSNPQTELLPDPSIIGLYQQIIVEPIVMLPMAQKPLATSAGQVSPGRVTSQQTGAKTSWSQWNISRFPPELLSRIFGCLDYDAIVQVQGTCRRFREVVQAHHKEIIFYRQLPALFRKKYPQSRSWQKWLVENGQHPFTTGLPIKESQIFNAEQYVALLSFHTLRTMMFTSGYRAVEVFARTGSTVFLQVEFSLASSKMFLFNQLNGRLCLLGQNGPGSWSEQETGLKAYYGLALKTRFSFGTDERYLSAFTSTNLIEILKHDRDHSRLQLASLQWLGRSHTHRLSPSGKYAAIYSETEGIESIRCFDDQGQWVPMPVEMDDRIDSQIEWINFCPSDKHLAFVHRKKLVILSVDSQGCWNFSGAITFDQHLGYYEFCPSGEWLLISFYERKPKFQGSVEMIRLEPTGEWKLGQRIFSDYLMLTFSPDGKYLVSTENVKKYPLWQLLKSGKWAFYGDLVDLGVVALPAHGQTDLKQNTIIRFSSCDNYLLVSSWDGAVKIWGRDEHGRWVVRGRAQHDGVVKFVRFSESGVHALTVDPSLMYIWGLDHDGLWSVKEIIPAKGVKCATFHPVAEHLVVSLESDNVRIWELRTDDSSGEAVKGGTVV